MAQDGINIRLEGGAQLDKILAKMQKSAGTKIINQSLTKASAAVRKAVKKEAPVSKEGVSGNKLSSRNHNKGTLRRSIKSGLRRKVNLGKSTFLASVYVQDGHKNKAPNNADGWYAHFVQTGKGFSGMSSWKSYKKTSFMKKGVDGAKSAFRKIMNEQMTKKIVEHNQKLINKGLKGVV